MWRGGMLRAISRRFLQLDDLETVEDPTQVKTKLRLSEHPSAVISMVTGWIAYT